MVPAWLRPYGRLRLPVLLAHEYQSEWHLYPGRCPFSRHFPRLGVWPSSRTHRRAFRHTVTLHRRIAGLSTCRAICWWIGPHYCIAVTQWENQPVSPGLEQSCDQYRGRFLAGGLDLYQCTRLNLIRVGAWAEGTDESRHIECRGLQDHRG